MRRMAMVAIILFVNTAICAAALSPEAQKSEKPIEIEGIAKTILFSVRNLPIQPHEKAGELHHFFPVLGSTEIQSHSEISGIIGLLNQEIIPPVPDHCTFDARYGLRIFYETKTVDYLLSSQCRHGFEYDGDKLKRTFSLRQPGSSAKVLDQYLLKAGVPLQQALRKKTSRPPNQALDRPAAR